MKVDLICLFCDEPIVHGDDLARHLIYDHGSGPRLAHEECMMRQVIGGLNHINGACTCCGGKLPPDPPGLSKRAAARVAYAAYMVRHPA